MKSLCLAAAAMLGALLLCYPAPAAELELIQTIDLKGKAGGLDHVALDAKRDRLFVANKANNTLDIVDLKTNKLIKQIPSQTAIQGIAYAPEVDRIFVGLGSKGLCNIFDGDSYEILKTVNFNDDADNVRYNPRTGRVYVAHAEKALGVLDAKTFAKKGDIKLSAMAEGFEMETKRPRLYLVTPKPSQLLVIDTEKNEVLKTYPIKMAEGGHPLALDEENHRVYIGCRKEPLVVVVDTETGSEISGEKIPGGIDDLHIDVKKKKLYAACGEGFLVVLKQSGADKVEVVEKVATAKDAKTCLYVPETGRIYLAVPRQEGKDGPEIRVYQSK